MRIKKIHYTHIQFDYVAYSEKMYESIKRIGLSFPIKVDIVDGIYQCKDGHKRLSAIQDMVEKEQFNKREEVPYIVYNDGSSRSNDCWRGRNTH